MTMEDPVRNRLAPQIEAELNEIAAKDRIAMKPRPLDDTDRRVLQFLSVRRRATAFEIGRHLDRPRRVSRVQSNTGRFAVLKLVRRKYVDQEFDRGLHLNFYRINAAGRAALQGLEAA